MKMKTQKNARAEIVYFNVNDSGVYERMKRFKKVCREYGLKISYDGITPSAIISNEYGDRQEIWNGEYLVAVEKGYFFVCHGNVVRKLFKYKED